MLGSMFNQCVFDFNEPANQFANDQIKIVVGACRDLAVWNSTGLIHLIGCAIDGGQQLFVC
jgi:hypothetical protein